MFANRINSMTDAIAFLPHAMYAHVQLRCHGSLRSAAQEDSFGNRPPRLGPATSASQDVLKLRRRDPTDQPPNALPDCARLPADDLSKVRQRHAVLIHAPEDGPVGMVQLINVIEQPSRPGLPLPERVAHAVMRFPVRGGCCRINESICGQNAA